MYHAGHRNRFIGGTTFQNERRPFADRLPVLRVFHILEEMVLAHLTMTGAEKVNLLLSINKTQMWNRSHEILGGIDHAAAHRMTPELQRVLEFMTDPNRLADFDLTIGAVIRRVAQLAESRVSGAGVVPAVGGLQRQLLGQLVELDPQTRVHLLEQGTKGSGHDAATDENYIRIFNMCFAFHKIYWLVFC